MKLHLLAFILCALSVVSDAQKKKTGVSNKKGGGDCLYQGRKVCSGAVVAVLQYSKLVRVCDRGVLRYKQRRLIDKNSPERIGGQTRKEDCTAYGQLFCDGDVVKRFTSLVRVCEKGVLKFKSKSQQDKKEEGDVRQEEKVRVS